VKPKAEKKDATFSVMNVSAIIRIGHTAVRQLARFLSSFYRQTKQTVGRSSKEFGRHISELSVDFIARVSSCRNYTFYKFKRRSRSEIAEGNMYAGSLLFSGGERIFSSDSKHLFHLAELLLLLLKKKIKK